jgi:hypothetical protein
MLGVGVGFAATPILEDLKAADPFPILRGRGPLRGILQQPSLHRGVGVGSQRASGVRIGAGTSDQPAAYRPVWAAGLAGRPVLLGRRAAGTDRRDHCRGGTRPPPPRDRHISAGLQRIRLAISVWALGPALPLASELGRRSAPRGCRPRRTARAWQRVARSEWLSRSPGGGCWNRCRFPKFCLRSGSCSSDCWGPWRFGSRLPAVRFALLTLSLAAIWAWRVG